MSSILNMIETSGPGGAENIMVSLAKNQRSEQVTPMVCLQREGWVSKTVNELSIELILKPFHSTLDIAWLREMRRYVEENDIRLIHSHEFAMNLYGCVLSQLCRIPCVTTVHGKNYYPDKWYRRLIYRYVSKHSVLIAVSRDIEKFLIETVGVKSSNVRVIQNGIDLQKFEACKATRNAVREKLGIADNRFLIGAVGNLYPVKGHTYLLDAAAIVCRAHPDATFIVAGRGGLEEELKQKAVSLGLEKNFLFLGYRDDVDDLLQAMDVFAMSSLSEGMPVSILEAMAARTPVISTDVGGISEVIRHRETGLLTPAASPKGLAEGILSYMENDELRHAVTENAYQSVCQGHSMTAMMEAYEELYAELCGD